jgi:aminocarboxymuconate-semialdehyde decarboxylase
MIIEFHNHVHLPEWAKRPYWQGKCPMVIDNVLRVNEEAGVDLIVISNALHELKGTDRPYQLKIVKELNRYFAELQDKYPGRLVALAGGVPGAGDEMLKEIERAIKVDGLKGVMITSSINGAYPDDDEALPFFNLVTDLDVPVMMHPPTVAFGEERMKDYRLASSVGRPFDNSLALARLIVRGIYEKFPTLKLVATHLGGGISEMIGRLDYAYELQEEAYFLGSYSPMLIKKKPSDYLKMVYLDSVCYHLPAARCAMETVGIDHFLFGTDAPPLWPLKKRGMDMIDGLGLSAADKAKVMSGNAKRLLKLN